MKASKNRKDDLNFWTDLLAALKQKCYVVDRHPSLLITGRVVKALASCSQGIPAVVLPGVLSLEELARAGFSFFFALDADCPTKSKVKPKRSKNKLKNKFQPEKIQSARFSLILAGGFMSWSGDAT